MYAHLLIKSFLLLSQLMVDPHDKWKNLTFFYLSEKMKIVDKTYKR